ncbi:MAG: SIS domain-containing protein [Sandaracinaceae bacterium]
MVVGCGSSAFAARFSVHLEAERTGRPALQLDPSFLDENPEVDASWSDATVLVFSASGEIAEVARVAEHLRMWGAEVVGITSAGSGRVLLDTACDHVFRTGVGSEDHDLMTKSVSAAFFAAAALSGVSVRPAIRDAANDLEHALGESVAERVADRLAGARSVAWVGDGPLYAAAQEAAAKLSQLARIPSSAWSAAELHHGPAGFLESSDAVVLLTAGTEPTLLRRSLCGQLKRFGPEVLTLGEADLSNDEPADESVSLTGPLWSAAPVLLGLTQRIACLVAQQVTNPPALRLGGWG